MQAPTDGRDDAGVTPSGGAHGASDDPDVAQTLRQLGIAPEAIQRAIARGDPQGAIFDAVLLPDTEDRVISASEIEVSGGLPATEIVALMQAFGLPAPDPSEPAFTQQEARIFRELASLRAVWPSDLTIQVARVYGRLLARIAQTEVQLFRLHVEPRLLDDADDHLDGLRAVQSAFSQLRPLADRLVLTVHRRWLEHELGQAAVQAAETDAGARRLPGAVQVAFLFCDLKDFTAYANRQGDEAAVDAVARLADVVTRERGERVRLMKSLGDGYMLCYSDAVAAVSAGARIVKSMSSDAGPGAHASVHEGAAIAREGDYFGSAVNLTARLLTTADRDELVATTAVVHATEGAFAWESRGTRRIRGISEPVELFRLAHQSLAEAQRPMLR
jgi:adenylate cyclase